MDFGLLLLRIIVGALLVGHGTQKIYGWFGGRGPERTAAFFASLGYPKSRRLAVLAGSAEAGGGALLVLGLATPVGAAAIIGVMMNAIFSAHAGKGPWVANGGWEYPLVLATIAFSLAWMGPGAYALDSVIGWSPHDAMSGLSAMALGVLTGIVVLSRRRPTIEAREARAARAAERPSRAA